MEGHRLWVEHKHDWSHGFFLLLPQAAALPGSDAGSDIVEPASGFVIKNHQITYSMHAQCRLWGTLLKRGVLFVQWRRTRIPIKGRDRDPIMHGRTKSSNTVYKRLTLTQTVRSKPILTVPLMVIGLKVQRLNVLPQFSVFQI